MIIGGTYFCLNVLNLFHAEFSILVLLLILQHITNLMGPCVLQILSLTEGCQVNISIRQIRLQGYRSKSEHLDIITNI